MRALQARAHAPLALIDLHEERPAGPGWLRIAVAVTGVCGSDWPLLRIPPAKDTGAHGVFGHEVAGVVAEATGRDDQAWVGRRVTFDPMASCGVCEACRADRKNVCTGSMLVVGRDMPGGFAEAVWVRASQTLELGAGISFRRAAFVEPMAVIVRAFRRVAMNANTSLAVVGDGTLAFLALAAAAHAGIAERTFVYKHDARGTLARELVLATRTSDRAEPLPAADRDAFDVVIEAAGGAQSASIARAVDMVRPGGTILVLGAFDRDFTAGFPYRVAFRKEAAVIGVHSYGLAPADPDSEFTAALALLADENLPVEALVERYLTLDEAPAYLASLLGGARTGRPKIALEIIR